MPTPIELRGRPASPGIAAGPLVRLNSAVGSRIPTGDRSGERAALEAAVASAVAQIERLMAQVEGDSAAILEFQAALLADTELISPALHEIETGASAELAWETALAGQIATYAEAENEYFRARAADLTDLRDRVLRNLSGAEAEVLPSGAILVGEDITPTRFLETDWSKGGGIVLAAGSDASHVAMLARSRGVPMVVGLGQVLVNGHTEALLDGERGLVVLSPGVADWTAFEARSTSLAGAARDAESFLFEPARTADGTDVKVMVNITGPDDVDLIDVESCDGVGLMRTEFLFGDGLPDEETQYGAYAKVLDWANGRPVTIRTVDAGGDKPVTGFTIEERNPFLGFRGVRLSLARPEVFCVQLRALCRAATRGNLKIMLPMVTIPDEIVAASSFLDRVMAELTAEGTPATRPPLGIMVEVPAVAIVPHHFSSAAFLSIGSNDLTQYVTAAARDSTHVAALNDFAHPAVDTLITGVARYAAASGMELSICGDAASSPIHLPNLLHAGLRSLSVAPAVLGRVKATVAAVHLEESSAG